MNSNKTVKAAALLALLFLITNISTAQTDLDAIMMGKKRFCVGPAYMYSSWKNYWEGTLKRNNENLGTVSAQSYALMGNYGVTDKLNVLFNVPYVSTKASAGTLHSMKGVQDLSLYVKYLPLEKDLWKGTFAFYAIGGVSVPLSNYVADYLPLSIGLRSKTASLRALVDYQYNNIFFTGSATWVLRDNIKIDRTAYYTDHLILSNEVEMPNAANFNIRAGYRSDRLIAEAVFNQWKTLGGFDITRNNMPFPSNRMDAATLGAKVKYVIFTEHEFAVEGGADFTVAGRNMGQSNTYHGGLLYVFELKKKEKKKAAVSSTGAAVTQ